MRALLPTVIDDLTDPQLAQIYAWPTSTGLPWLRANFAATIDGAVTDAAGLSEGVSSPDDKHVFALLRATCDAVVVGAGTARAEGYGPVRVRKTMAALRRSAGLTAPPRLVVVTNSGSLNPVDPMFTEVEPSARTIVITGQQTDHDTVAVLREVAEVFQLGDATVDLPAMQRQLFDVGLRRLVCEGGPTLLGDLLAANLVDDLCLTTSPLIAGQATDTRTNLTGRHGLNVPRSARIASLVQAENTLLARWLITKDVG